MITRTRSNESRASSSSRRDWGVISIGLAFAETMRIMPTTTEKRSLILSTVFNEGIMGGPVFPRITGLLISWFRGRTTAIVISPSWHDLACLLFSSDGHTLDLANFPRKGENRGRVQPMSYTGFRVRRKSPVLATPCGRGQRGGTSRGSGIASRRSSRGSGAGRASGVTVVYLVSRWVRAAVRQGHRA